jgi:RimJ/RimL family protein N-acetyltransferase
MISCDERYIPYLCKMIGCRLPPDGTCIVSVRDDNTPLAGVVYEGYNEQIVFAHIWIDVGVRPDRDWMAAIFDYPFNRMNVHKIVGQVKSSNTEARKLDEHLGFQLESSIKDFFAPGDDLLAYTMTREQCRVLNSHRWAKYVERMSRAE